MAKRFALLVGNSAFRHETLGRLFAPPNDVHQLAEILKDPDVASFNIDVKIDSSLVDVKSAVGRLFRDRHPDDVLLFYYSGHGLRDKNGSFYLALTETDPSDPDPGSIDEHWLRRMMDESFSQRQLVILDCCHSGAFIPAALTARAGATSPVITRATFDPAGHGRYIMAATTAELSAYEQAGESLYTHFLIEGLRTGGGATDTENITVHDLHDFVKRRAGETVSDIMRPQLWVAPGVNPVPLVIARNKNPRPRLGEALVEQLFSNDTREVELAVFKLKEIAENSDDPIATDARQVLAERLEKADQLNFTVGKRIEQVLTAESASLSDIEKAKLEDRLAELEINLGKKNVEPGVKEIQWLEERRALQAGNFSDEKLNNSVTNMLSPSDPIWQVQKMEMILSDMEKQIEEGESSKASLIKDIEILEDERVKMKSNIMELQQNLQNSVEKRVGLELHHRKNIYRLCALIYLVVGSVLFFYFADPFRVSLLEKKINELEIQIKDRNSSINRLEWELSESNLYISDIERQQTSDSRTIRRLTELLRDYGISYSLDD